MLRDEPTKIYQRNPRIMENPVVFLQVFQHFFSWTTNDFRASWNDGGFAPQKCFFWIGMIFWAENGEPNCFLRCIHPGRLTWNLQIIHLERKMIFQTSRELCSMLIFRGVIWICWKTLRFDPFLPWSLRELKVIPIAGFFWGKCGEKHLDVLGEFDSILSGPLWVVGNMMSHLYHLWTSQEFNQPA